MLRVSFVISGAEVHSQWNACESGCHVVPVALQLNCLIFMMFYSLVNI